MKKIGVFHLLLLENILYPYFNSTILILLKSACFIAFI